MRMLNSEYGINIEFKENRIQVLDIEKPTILRNVMQSIWQQCNGENGNFILSEKDKELKMEKMTECIFNPFGLDLNNKKIITQLYKDMSQLSLDELYQEQGEVNRVIVQYLDKICDKFPYQMDFNIDLDIKSLLKIFEVKLKVEEENFESQLINYIKLMNKICKISLFVLYDIKSFISKDKIDEFYKELLYEKINILIIESRQSEKNRYESYCILDKDLCIINIE